MSAAGLSDYEIARRLGMSRVTVLNWRKRKPNFSRRRHVDLASFPRDEPGYAYLLGIYLGDGCLTALPRGSLRLGITLDRIYPAVIEEVRQAILAVDPGTHVCTREVPGAVALFASSPLWEAAFPQHGKGRKHERRIELAAWQASITGRYPEMLLRGLVHSDGARCINRFKTKLPSGRVAEYAYPRYFFSNLSRDIRRIFCDHCDLLGIRWTQSNHRNISIAHRRSVALLDEFIGPKS